VARPVRDQGLVVVARGREYEVEEDLGTCARPCDGSVSTTRWRAPRENAYGNRFWPALYPIDRNGRIVVYRHCGGARTRPPRPGSVRCWSPAGG
jgi:hypothetical protein